MWALASVTFYLSVNCLSQAVSYPISNSGPSVISNIWSVFYYKEIKGGKNLLILSGGFIFAIIGAVLCGLSF